MQTPQLSRVLVLLLSVWLAACSTTGGAPEPMSDEDRLNYLKETAWYHYENGDLVRAESQALKGLEIDERDVQLRLMVAWIQLRSDTREGLIIAEGMFEELQSSDDYRAWLGLAEALERLGVLYTESALAIERGDRQTLAGTPEDRAAELRESAEENWRRAIELYERTLAESPEQLKSINGLQRTSALLGDYAAGLHWAERLLQITEEESNLWEAQLARPDLTAREENRLRLNKQRTEELKLRTHLFASSMLRKQDRTQEALGHLQIAAALDPDSPDVYGRRAQLLAELEDYEGALADLDTYLRTSTEPYDHPDIQRAFDLKTSCEEALASAVSQ